MRPRIEIDLLAGVVSTVEQWELASAVKVLAGRLLSECDVPEVLEIRRACSALNAERQFEQCRVLAQAWQDSQPPDLTIMRHQAQACINLSMLDAAHSLLQAGYRLWPALPFNAVTRKEKDELDGLTARIAKQRFVDGNDQHQLELAYGLYLKVYNDQPSHPYWHGVNAVALQARAEREGLDFGGDPSGALAARLYAQVQAIDNDDPWRLATLSELSLALGQCDTAELWLHRLLQSPKCTSFVLDSYDRQLREIWQGQALQGGARCADRLATILARHQITRLSTWSITPARARDLRHADLEKAFSDVGTFSVSMIKRMLDACQSIGCVCDQTEARLGTGFVLDAADLGGTAGDKLFVTNAHVLSDTVDGAIPVMDGQISFELGSDAQNNPRFCAVEKLIYTSPPGPLGMAHPATDFLDVTIVKLRDIPASVKGLRLARALPIIDGKAKAYVIGHPRGSGLQVSVHDSELLACDGHARLLHYRTPTDPGSSGSPVFNEAWHIIALHHGGSREMPRLNPATGIYEANEGVTLSAIRAGYAVEQRSPSGDAGGVTT